VSLTPSGWGRVTRRLIFSSTVRRSSLPVKTEGDPNNSEPQLTPWELDSSSIQLNASKHRKTDRTTEIPVCFEHCPDAWRYRTVKYDILDRPGKCTHDREGGENSEAKSSTWTAIIKVWEYKLIFSCTQWHTDNRLAIDLQLVSRDALEERFVWLMLNVEVLRCNGISRRIGNGVLYSEWGSRPRGRTFRADYIFRLQAISHQTKGGE